MNDSFSRYSFGIKNGNTVPVNFCTILKKGSEWFITFELNFKIYSIKFTYLEHKQLRHQLITDHIHVSQPKCNVK